VDSSPLGIENWYPNMVLNTKHTTVLGRNGITAEVPSFSSHCNELGFS